MLTAGVLAVGAIPNCVNGVFRLPLLLFGCCCEGELLLYLKIDMP